MGNEREDEFGAFTTVRTWWDKAAELSIDFSGDGPDGWSCRLCGARGACRADKGKSTTTAHSVRTHIMRSHSAQLAAQEAAGEATSEESDGEEEGEEDEDEEMNEEEEDEEEEEEEEGAGDSRRGGGGGGGGGGR